MAGWDTERALLLMELVQRRDEGCAIPEALVHAVHDLPIEHGVGPVDGELLYARLWTDLSALTPDAELRASEPDELEAIRALRPDGPRDLGWTPDPATLIDRLHGAWTGRAVGCALGKPVESAHYGMAMAHGRSVGRQRIRSLLEAQGAWPLRDYFSAAVPAGHPALRCPASTREHIAYMEPDDDIHYTLVGLGVLEDVGPEFQWYDVAWYWTRHLPYSAICTAETQAILNFWNRSAHMPKLRGGTGTEATAAWTRTHKNPYREWIGAQIRSDGWAFACAGKPELAAEFAWRDACWTHTRNGIYGAMLFAAIQAAAFAEPDPRRCIEIGLSEIPPASRLARGVRTALEWRQTCPNLESALARMDADDTLARMSPVHTINNAVACVLALLYAQPEIDAATCAAVSAGIDTDCNGATVGSVVGAITGRAGYGGQLGSRLNDTIRPEVFGFQDVRMRSLAERHARVWQRVHEWSHERRANQ